MAGVSFLAWASLFLTAAPAFAELKRQARLGVAFGEEDGKVVIRQVTPGSNAARAGLEARDVLVSVAGVKSEATPAYLRSLLRRDAGDALDFAISRQGGETRTVRVTYSAPALETPEGLRVEYGSVKVRDHERRTLVTSPKDKKKHTAILFLAGADAHRRNRPAGRIRPCKSCTN